MNGRGVRAIAVTRMVAGMAAAAGPTMPLAAQADPIRTPLDTAAIARVLREEMRATHTPGAAIAVVRGGRIVYRQGFGVASIETGEPVTPTTLFRIGSTTKMVTGLTAVLLEQAGALQLARPIGGYARGLSPALAQLTLAQLLTHGGGMINAASGAGPHDDAALGVRVRQWTGTHRFGPADDVYSYSGPGYWLAGYAIEQAGGGWYADVVRARVLAPLGMTRSTFRPLEAMTYPLAQDHRVRDTIATVLRPFTDDVTTWASGSLFSSAAELARLTIALVDSGRVDGTQALPAAAVAALLTPRLPIPGDVCRYAYGLSACTRGGIRTVSHYGFRVGSGSVIAMAPDSQAAVIVLANRNGGILARTANAAMQQLVGLAPDAPDTTTGARPDASRAPFAIDRWVGRYANGPDTLRLVRRADGLVYRYGAQESATRPDGADALLVLGADGSPTQRFLRVVGARSGRPYLHDGLSAFARVPSRGARD